MKYLCSIAFFIGLNATAVQGQTADCAKRVRSVYEHFNYITTHLKEGDQVYYRYTTKVILQDDSNGGNTTTEAAVTVGKEKIQSISQEVILYQDSVDVFTILPFRKLIYRADSKTKLNKKYVDNSALKLQDTLFDVGVVKECRLLPNGDETVVMDLEQSSKLFPYYEVEWQVNTSKNIIRKITVRYPSRSRVKRIEYIFHEIDPFHTDPAFQQTASSRILTANQKLLTKFKDYTIVDTRKKNSHSKNIKK